MHACSHCACAACLHVWVQVLFPCEVFLLQHWEQNPNKSLLKWRLILCIFSAERTPTVSNEETRRFPVFLIFSFFIILQQKEYKAFRKHLPYFKGNSKCFAWLQQLKSFFLFFFLNISIESVTLVHAQLQKWDLQTREGGEKEGGMQSTLGELRGDGTSRVRGRKRRKTGSHTRERQRERQL